MEVSGFVNRYFTLPKIEPRFRWTFCTEIDFSLVHVIAYNPAENTNSLEPLLQPCKRHRLLKATITT